MGVVNRGCRAELSPRFRPLRQFPGPPRARRCSFGVHVTTDPPLLSLCKAPLSPRYVFGFWCGRCAFPWVPAPRGVFLRPFELLSVFIFKVGLLWATYSQVLCFKNPPWRSRLFTGAFRPFASRASIVEHRGVALALSVFVTLFPRVCSLFLSPPTCFSFSGFSGAFYMALFYLLFSVAIILLFKNISFFLFFVVALGLPHRFKPI